MPRIAFATSLNSVYFRQAKEYQIPDSKSISPFAATSRSLNRRYTTGIFGFKGEIHREFTSQRLIQRHPALAIRDSDYWIMNCGNELIASHGDIWSTKTMEMYAGLYLLTVYLNESPG